MDKWIQIKVTADCKYLDDITAVMSMVDNSLMIEDYSDVEKELVRIAPERLVYVSCDPSSLARDLKKLTEKKYRIKEVCAADLFPRTKHVETVVLLSKR